jgi:serine/threonine protein kinase
MGVVYLAEQREPIRRTVCLKVIKPGMDTRDVIDRFKAEQQTLALMDHPNIARVLDAGVTEEGRPYFVMDYVAGNPITAYCDEHRLTTEERIELFVKVCDGIRHAHQRGIIHRDIKPSNVLVAEQDAGVVPKVIDFGVARAMAGSLTDRTTLTQWGQLVGTPEYMSPEQTALTGQDLDTRTDVYSLGVVLYELLVGALPLDRHSWHQAGLEELLRRVREEEPPMPSTRVSTQGATSTAAAGARRTDARSLARRLRGELDWIVTKALEKDRTRRYLTAAELAADLGRYLTHEPVSAGPPGAGYRLRKFLRRNRIGVLAAGTILLGLLVGVGGLALGLLRSSRFDIEAQRAEESRRFPVPAGITPFFNDLEGFDAAAGSPPISVSFDDIPAGTDISGKVISGITFNPGNTPPGSAALIVVRGADTFTGDNTFYDVTDPATNRLFPTSGENVLSPGGSQLVPGPAQQENDDLELVFDPPVSAVGFDLLFQSLDAGSYVFIFFFDAEGSRIGENVTEVPTFTEESAVKTPGGAVFVGFVSERPIGRILINETDDDGGFPDSNVGYDSFRISAAPAGVQSGRVDQ